MTVFSQGDRFDMNGRLRRLAAGMALATILLGSASCGDVSRQGRAPSFLLIESLTAASGGGEFSPTLQSDVVRLINRTINGVDTPVPTIFEDMGQVTWRIVLKDQGPPGSTTSASVLNNITVNRYHVSYRRTDGRNVQGVDVPYAFDGAATTTVSSSVSDLNFTIVRIQAKLEAPLRAMGGAGGRIVISTIADVTFYGRDQAGNEVSQTASMSINFSDWADPA